MRERRLWEYWAATSGRSPSVMMVLTAGPLSAARSRHKPLTSTCCHEKTSNSNCYTQMKTLNTVPMSSRKTVTKYFCTWFYFNKLQKWTEKFN